MPRAKIIFAMVRRVRGKNKGKLVKRYFKSEAQKVRSLKNYMRLRTGKGKPAEYHKMVQPSGKKIKTIAEAQKAGKKYGVGHGRHGSGLAVF